LTEELVRQGHDVTLFASDSSTPFSMSERRDCSIPIARSNSLAMISRAATSISRAVISAAWMRSIAIPGRNACGGGA
jgi:hypothetical protein